MKRRRATPGCTNCHEPDVSHFVAPTVSEPGFYTCEKRTASDMTPEQALPPALATLVKRPCWRQRPAEDELCWCAPCLNNRAIVATLRAVAGTWEGSALYRSRPFSLDLNDWADAIEGGANAEA